MGKISDRFSVLNYRKKKVIMIVFCPTKYTYFPCELKLRKPEKEAGRKNQHVFWQPPIIEKFEQAELLGGNKDH